MTGWFQQPSPPPLPAPGWFDSEATPQPPEPDVAWWAVLTVDMAHTVAAVNTMELGAFKALVKPEEGSK